MRVRALETVIVCSQSVSVDAESEHRCAENETRIAGEGWVLRIDHRDRLIELAGSGKDEDSDPMRWPIFCCVLVQDGVARLSWDRWQAGESALRFLLAHRRRILQVRRALFAALPVELRVWIVRMRFPWMTFHDVSRLWKSLEALRPIARVDVRLLALWLCLPVRASQPDVHAVATFRKSVWQRYGLASSTWRALCRHGWRLFPAMARSRCPVTRRIHAQGYLWLLGSDRIEGAMSAHEKRTLWEVATLCPEISRYRSDLVRALLRHIPEEFAAGRVLDETDLMAIVDTLFCIDSRIEQFRPDANQARAGWRWWERRLSELLGGEEERVLSDQAWTCSVESFAFGTAFVVPLRDTAALRHEGRQMRNCLAGSTEAYAERCLKSGVRIYSLRHCSADGPRNGTVALALDVAGRPFVAEAVGPANRPLSKRLAPVIDELLRRYTAADMQWDPKNARRGPEIVSDRGSHGAAHASTQCLVRKDDPYAIVSVVHVANEQSLADFVDECARRHRTIPGHSVLVLERHSSRLAAEFLSRARMHAEASGGRSAHETVCIVVPVPKAMTAIAIRSIVEQVELQQSPSAIVIDATGLDVQQVAGELEALAAFLGMPIHLVSVDGLAPDAAAQSAHY